MIGADETPRTSPPDMRTAMADYIRTVHQAYLSTSAGQPPAVRGRMTLVQRPFTVVAAGVRNLHVIATTEQLAPPTGQEVAIEDELGAGSQTEIRWTVRFYDPVVLPQLGMIDESAAPASAAVRRAIGIATYAYHLIVQPGSELTTHHAGHAGAGLAMNDVADARDFDSIRSKARGREHLVDEMEGAAQAGLVHAQALLATVIAPNDPQVIALARAPQPDAVELRKAVLAALRAASTPPSDLSGPGRG